MVNLHNELDKAVRDLSDNELLAELQVATELRDDIASVPQPRPAHVFAVLRLILKREVKRRRREFRQLEQDFRGGPVAAWWGDVGTDGPQLPPTVQSKPARPHEQQRRWLRVFARRADTRGSTSRHPFHREDES